MQSIPQPNDELLQHGPKHHEPAFNVHTIPLLLHRTLFLSQHQLDRNPLRWRAPTRHHTPHPHHQSGPWLHGRLGTWIRTNITYCYEYYYDRNVCLWY